jgi:hypothetical protein
MLESTSSIKNVTTQTPEDKMYLLKLIAHQMLGAKWMYYRKIKRGDTGLKLFKEKSLMEQMKATRSALRFTTRNTKKLYRLAYQECAKDIKKFTGIKVGLPELPDAIEGEELPSLSAAFDAIIIAWTPLKFLAPAQKIRSKGSATQRHSEGLVAKLYFKVAAYYAVPENWDTRKLTLYLRTIRKESSYQDIVSALEPLKADLQNFAEVYELFKFGKASLSKDISQDIDAFDDAMSVESFDSQLRTLYWYDFIYQALEMFVIRYYLTLVTATASLDTIQYLTAIFEPALAKAVENRVMFVGSFETDRTKTTFRQPYQEYVVKMSQEPVTKKLKTKEGVYESYTYNLPLLNRWKIDFDLTEQPSEQSQWWHFLRQYILAIERPILTVDTNDPLFESPEQLSAELDQIVETETRQFVLLQIMRAMIIHASNKRQAKYKILERFKLRVKTDFELEGKRIAEMKKMAEKKYRELSKKVMKYKRLEQDETVAAITRDIDAFKQNVENKIKVVRQNSKIELNQQKERISSLFQEVTKEKTLNLGITARVVVLMAKQIKGSDVFIATLPDYLARKMPEKYYKDLEPLYKNLFDILDLSPPQKKMIIQSLERATDHLDIKLELDEADQLVFDKSVKRLKIEIERICPGVFGSKIIFTNKTIPIDDLLRLSIDHRSLHNLLCLKVASPQTTQTTNLKPETIKALVDLNRLLNPVPRYQVGQTGKEKEKNYEKRINTAQLESLLRQL